MQLSPINFKILACTLDMEGHDSAAALRACGIHSADELDRQAWLPLDAFDRLMQAALEESLDPSFGLTAGTSIALTRYGLIAPLAMNARNMRQVLEDIDRFGPLLMPQPELQLTEQNGQARIHIQPLGLQPQTRRFRAEVVASGLVQMIRACASTPQDLHGAYFAHPQPAYVYRYAEIFGPRVSFDAPAYAIHFNADVLDRKFMWHDPAAYLEARTRAEAALAAMQATRSDLTEQLRALILGQLPRVPKSTEAAAQLCMSERSLRRHLAELGTSYAAVLQECQILVAKRELAEGRQSIKQIALSLGFSSVSCFHRAFRRWTDSTPTNWREAALKGHAPEP